MSGFDDHAGGLVFGGDGMLYYVVSKAPDSVPAALPDSGRELRGIVVRMDPETHKREEIAELERPDAPAYYVSRGAADRNGDLFFSNVSDKKVTGFFKLTPPAERKKPNAHLPIRIWG